MKITSAFACAAFICGVAASATAANSAVLFSDDFQTNLNQWERAQGGNYTGTAAIVAVPGGGNALTFGSTTGSGDIQAIQTFSSSTGTFTLTFDVICNGHSSGCGATVGNNNGWLADSPGAGVTFADTSKNWEQVSYTFKAGNNYQLAIEDWWSASSSGADSFYLKDLTLTDNSVGTAVNTLTVTPIPTAVPEPSTWTLMLAGFAGLGFASYRRAKSKASASLAPVR